MATVLIERLKSKNYNLMSWMSEDLVRMLGVCVTLRDEGHLDSEQILGQLKVQDDIANYNLKSKINEPKPIEKTCEELEQEFIHNLNETREQIKQLTEEKLKILDCITKLEIIQHKQNSEESILNNVLKLAREQLDIELIDIESSLQYKNKNIKKHISLDEYIKEQQDWFKTRLSVWKENREKLQDTPKSNKAEQYKKFLEDLEKVFK